MVVPMAAVADPLRFLVSSAWAMPFGKFEGDRFVGGILYDLAQAVGEQIAQPIAFVVLPRKRLDGAALSGDVDLYCYSNPRWTLARDAFVWSDSLFKVDDVLFATKGTPAPTGIADIPAGARVSSVLGYQYQALSGQFESGALRREDVIDQEKVMLKVTAARTPYGISDAPMLDWYQHETPHHNLASWRLVVASSDFHCAVPKAGRVSPDVLLRALSTLKKNGTFDAITRKYR